MIEELQPRIAESSGWIQAVKDEMAQVLVGQQRLVDRLLIGLLCNGHILLEGVPGLAKTLAVKALSGSLDASFARFQFTPDLLPADLVGTMVYHPQTMKFEPKLGPIFNNLILADEINRAPAKVQSALLEAMQERQVTLGDHSYPLPQPFLVLATQNPIDQEGTYQLPEAQLDRFLLKVNVGYPGKDEELTILDRMATSTRAAQEPGARRGLAARHDQPGPDSPGAGFHARPRVRHAAGRQGHGARRAAPPHPAHLRGGGRGNHHRLGGRAHHVQGAGALMISNFKFEISNSTC